MVQVKQQIITDSNKVNRGKNTKAGVAIHETANTSQGAGAQAHANLQSKGNVRAASWHFSVDDQLAVQSFNLDARCWHAGDGSGPGNNAHIAIEICVNPDSNYVQACKNAAELVRQLREQGVGDGVKQHNAFSGKDCPNFMREGRDGVTWDVFLGWVANGTGSEPVVNPIPTPTPVPGGIAEDGWFGAETIGEIQRQAGTVVDNELWYQYEGNKQPAFTTGWVYNYAKGKGSPAWTWVQSRLGTPGDGVFGEKDLRALEARAGFPYDGRLDGPSNTVKWLQHALNTHTL